MKLTVYVDLETFHGLVIERKGFNASLVPGSMKPYNS